MYKSIDTLQKALSQDVFSYTSDAKKAAGRSLGTIVEIITFYLLREWGLEDSVSIERGLPEYGNRNITHNVEFTLHPILDSENIMVHLPVTATKILKNINSKWADNLDYKTNALLDSKNIMRNSCLLGENEKKLIVANLKQIEGKEALVNISVQHPNAYAMFECKRVGVEEGSKKGPQTIEKAKQGAYVAQMTSSLQKVRDDKGNRCGLLYHNGKPIVRPYDTFIEDIINGDELLKNFILSVGVVSNHGNWFTSENQNKELKVLAESYDWLLFLTDEGFATFITDLLLRPEPEYQAARDAFKRSYKEGKKTNVFTKTKIDYDAHIALCTYFSNNIENIEKWFNVIAPEKRSINDLKDSLYKLKNKDWRNIL